MPDVREKGSLSDYPMILNGVPNYPIPGTGQWFRVQLWRNGEKIYDGRTDGTSEEGSTIKVTWSILQNKYTSSVSDPSAISVTEAGIFTYNGYLGKNTNGGDPANIVKCQVTYKDLEYYATLPLITATTTDGSEIKLKKNTGFRYAVYTTDGIRPQYDDREPFTIEGISENANITYNLCGTIYGENKNGVITWQDKTDLEVNTRKSTAAWTALRPVDRYSGQCVSNAIEYVFDNGSIHIPVQLVYNRYGNSAMNGWDGNSISINDDGGFILAPKIGAGRKETDNSFTGMFMGEVKEAGKNKTDVGLMGYVQGQRSLFLNAEDGSAIFGKVGAGQIVIDPTNNQAQIYSGNYSTSKKTGLMIDLTTPEIRFGSGNFKVDANGNITATSGIIGGFTIGSSALFNSTYENVILTPTKKQNTDGVYLGIDGIGLGTRSNYGTENSPEYHRKFEVTSSGYLYTIRGRIGDFTLDDGVLYTEDADIWPLDNFDPLDPSTYDNPMDVRGIHLSSRGLSFNGAAIYWPSGDGNATPPNGLFCGINATDGTFYAQRARISPFWEYDENGVRAYALKNGGCYWKVDTQGSMQCGSIGFMADFPWKTDSSKPLPEEVTGIVGPFTGTSRDDVGNEIETTVLGMLTNGVSIALETDQQKNANVRLTGYNIYLDSKNKIYYRKDGATGWAEFGGGVATFG